MKRKISLLPAALLTAALLLLVGCFKETEIPVIDGPYIQMYYDGLLDCRIVYYNDAGPGIVFEVTGDGQTEIVSYSTASTGDKKAVYDSLCRKHSDFGYHGEDVYANQPAKRCYAKDLVSISVISDKDFDGDHPAGTPLNDIIAYNTYTPYPWIKGGYAGGPVFTRVRKLLDDVNEDDMKLLCAFNLCQLTFMSFPTASSFHNMSITVVTDDGRTHSFKKEVFF